MQTKGIRLRDNAKIRELKIPDDMLKKIRKALSTPISPHSRRELGKQMLGHSFCHCGEVPAIEISYDLQGATKREFYCLQCSKKLFQRMKDGEPEDTHEAAAFYGCIKGEPPRTSHDEYLKQEYIKTRKVKE